ncbi:MAG: transposase [Cytophagales bacterium]|nr:transposase [Cytophagales bacterium]
MEKFKDKYRIESTRLKGWDYANPGFYFVTGCVQNRECVLGRIENGKMILSNAGEMVKTEWFKTPEIRKNIQLDAFQIMPNHFHGIIVIIHRIDNPGNNKSDPNGIDGAIGRGDSIGRDGEIVETRCTVSLQSPSPSQPYLLPPEQYIRQGFSRTYKNKFGPQRNNLSSIMGGIKSAVTVNIRKMTPDFQWQRLFNDHVIRNSRELNRIRQYIKNNPANWDTDDKNPKNPERKGAQFGRLNVPGNIKP